ncbi:hypothetical protein BC943DRAFT_75773 [Umbelopsis sp. AD052]|nr:hypothetical protein BC943DRAFT_75773 [Umbelopsis sp. AD052]
MQDIMVFPSSRYFSHFSHLTNRGQVFAYSQVSIYSSQPEAYILKVHGTGSTDIHIQVRDLDALEVWRRHFWHGEEKQNSTKGNQHQDGLELLKHNMVRNNSDQSDSHMSQHRLLDRQNSEATLCSDRTMMPLKMEATEAHTSSYLQLPERYDEADGTAPSTTRRRRSTSLEMIQFHECTDLSLERFPSPDQLHPQEAPK